MVRADGMQADALLPRLQAHFFKPDPSGSGGFFQDRYFNGTFLDEQGCEGYVQLGIIASLPFFFSKMAQNLNFEMCFAPSTFSARGTKQNTYQIQYKEV